MFATLAQNTGYTTLPITRARKVAQECQKDDHTCIYEVEELGNGRARVKVIDREAKEDWFYL